MPDTNGTRCQLCLDVAVEDAARVLDALSSELVLDEVAAVLLRRVGADSGGRIAVEPVMARAHAARIPVVASLEGCDIATAAVLGADGAHLASGAANPETIAALRGALGQDAIIGVDCGWSRHAAMLAGEAGVDYVAFGSANRTDAQVGAAQTSDLLAWWSELFELPCLALGAHGPGDARVFADAGADFVGADLTAAGTGEQTVRLLERFAAAVAGHAETEAV